MYVIIKATPKAIKERKPIKEASRETEWLHWLPVKRTPEQVAVCEHLNLRGSSNMLNCIALGDFVQSSMTRLPIVRPIFYDDKPSDEVIWQQLAVMARQLPETINDAITAF